MCNFGNSRYLRNMVDGLKKNIIDTMRQIYYWRRIKNLQIASSDKLMGREEEAGVERMNILWGTDPVHLSLAGYKVMAESALELVLTKTPFTNSKVDSSQVMAQQA